MFAKTNITTAGYDLVENKSQLILTIQNSGSSLTEDFCSELLTNPTGFAVNDIIAFETHDGNRWLLLITEVNPGATNGESTIKYDVKVEK